MVIETGHIKTYDTVISSYKVYKGERIYLSSYVGCTLELHYVDKIIKDE